MTRAMRWIGAFAVAAMLAASGLFSSCAEGGRVVGQRTFLWHAGDATSSDLPKDVANPLRGRVAPTKPRLGTFGPDGMSGIALIGSTDPGAIRHFEGDPAFPGDPDDPALDPLDPQLARILEAPASVFVASIRMDGTIENVGGPLSATFPPDFGGDFSGDVFCVDPFSSEALNVLNGELPASGSRCIRGSVDTDTWEIYTDPSIIRMTGGAGEAPFRPAPDRASLEDPAGNDGTQAQGLFHPTRGMRTDTAMRYERNVDPATGRPLVARTGSEGIGSCSSVNAGVVSGVGVGGAYEGASVAYSTAFASHPLSVTTGVDVQNGPTSAQGPWRGGIGHDPGCLRPGGAPGGRSALTDFGDGIDDDLENTHALHNHHANLGLFAALCRATLGEASWMPPASCPLTVFNAPDPLADLTRVPVGEALGIAAAGSLTAAGGSQILTTISASSRYGLADVFAPLVSLNRLFNDPRSPLLDRNGDGVIDASGCDDADPAVRAGCDLGGFDGFDGRVALVAGSGGFPPGILVRDPGGIAALNAELAVNRILDTEVVQYIYQTLDGSLTNEQRGALGCGPLYGTRCDSSATRNTLNPIPGVPLDLLEKVFGPAGGLDLLNAEASAVLESVRAPDDPTPVTTPDPQPGTVGFPNELLCMRRLAGGELVRLPGCRGIESVTILREDADPTSAPVEVRVRFDDGYLPSLDGCVVGSRITYGGAANGLGFVPVIAEGAGPQLLAELPLCNDAIRERAVPQFVFDPGAPAPYDAEGRPVLIANPDVSPLASCDGAGFPKSGEPGTPMPGTPGMFTAGGQSTLFFRYCESDLARLEDLPLLHPLAACYESEVWWAARADEDAPDTGLPYGGCEFFHERDLVREFFEGRAQLFRSELAAVSWNLVQQLAVTSCDLRDLEDSELPTPEQAFRARPECFDAERPFTPGRCSYATPQHCKNVIGMLGLAPPIAVDGSTGDGDADGVPLDGDGSGIEGDAPCESGRIFGCDDNCPDAPNLLQVNSNGGDGVGSDGFGNLCDPDLDGDGDVDLADRSLQDECFLTGASTSIDCADADIAGDALDGGPVVRGPFFRREADPVVDGLDRLHLLRWLRDPSSQPGRTPTPGI